MARPVADYLVHFGLPESAQAPDAGCPGAVVCPEPPDESGGENHANCAQTAREEGFAQGFAAARMDYEARLAHEMATFEVRLAAERERWAQQEADRLSAKIEQALSEIGLRIAASVARILKPFLIDCLRAKIIDLLNEEIAALLASRDKPVIEIHGPEDLLGPLRKKLAAHSGTIAYFPNDSIEVHVVASQAMIETQIGAWIARFESLKK